MNVLIACEYSGRVRDAFTRRGHAALSCDFEPTETPGAHYQGDVRDLLFEGWDLLIAHPPCTYLSSSGMHWTTRGLRDPKLTDAALDFVELLWGAPVPRICLENPVGVINSRRPFMPAPQYIQPYQFGEDASKKTGLWLKNLSPLQPTKKVVGRLVCCGLDLPETVGIYGCPECNGAKKAARRWANQTARGQNKLGPCDTRSTERSRTFQGIAAAMAEQWGGQP